MARAKRTDRADARRRYRVTQAETTSTDDSVDDEESTAAPTARPARPATSARTASSNDGPAPRPGFFSSFRAAARPINVREDIPYIPTLILRTRAVWIPALAAIASGALFLLAQPLGSNGFANLLFQLFVLPPTIAGAFLAGILAPRATYIAGGIAALIGALVFAVAVLATPSNIYATPGTITTPGASPDASAVASAAPSASPDPAASGSTGTGTDTVVAFDRTATIIQSLLISVPFGIAIGGFGGYYKRFLYASNPNRQRRQLQQQREKQQRSGSKNQPKRRF